MELLNTQVFAKTPASSDNLFLAPDLSPLIFLNLEKRYLSLLTFAVVLLLEMTI